MIIETHCHLDMLKKQSPDEAIEKAKEVGVEKIITISVSPKNLDIVIKLSQENENVFCSQGIHPHEANDFNQEVLDKIEKNVLANKKVLAVGEIGLDYHYNFSVKENQIEAFKKQLELAVKLDKPIIIHTREADEDTIEILKEYGPQLKRKGVLHSYTSGKKLAELAIGLGFKIGFNGIITFKNAEEVRDIVELCPLENILTETDSPYLSPMPHRGKENAPFRLPHIIEKIAEIKKLDTQEVEKVCYKNACDLFAF